MKQNHFLDRYWKITSKCFKIVKDYPKYEKKKKGAANIGNLFRIFAFESPNTQRKHYRYPYAISVATIYI